MAVEDVRLDGQTAMMDIEFARPPVDRPGALGYGSYEATLAALEKAVAPGWILGSQFSAADVYIGSQINWGLMTKGLEARPAFLAYAERCGERPALKRVIAADA